jgi:hypothetical protein
MAVPNLITLLAQLTREQLADTLVGCCWSFRFAECG